MSVLVFVLSAYSVGLAARRRGVARRSVARLTGRAAPPVVAVPAWPRRLGVLAVPPPALVATLHDAGVPGSVLDVVPVAWPVGVVVVAAAAAGALLVSGVLLAALLLGGTAAAARAGLAFLRGRAVRRVEADLPLALDEVVRGLRSGVSLTQAFAEAAALPGPLGRDLREVVFVAAHGGGLGAALEAWARRRPLPGVRLTVAALTLGLDAGGAQARAVDGVATTLRERQQLAAEVRALASQARLSAVVLTVAPLGFAALMAAADREVADFFLHHPMGVLCLAVGVGLDAVAAGWMSRVTRVAP